MNTITSTEKCHTNWEGKQSRIMEIPDDLILEIFFRLPCNDIVRSKCVCRAWNRLLVDPNFRSNQARNSPFYTLFLCHCYHGNKWFCLLEFAADGEYVKTTINLRVPGFSEERSEVNIISGSCNGLLFLLHRKFYDHRLDEEVYLCNPLWTGCVAITEDKETRASPHHVDYKVAYIHSINKFKLLRAVFAEDGLTVVRATILAVGEDDEWRIVEDPLALLCACSRGVSFRGCYHWIPEKGNIDWIPAFDFGKETSSTVIPKPLGLSGLSSDTMSLRVFSNHLSLVHFDLYETAVWTMKEYGVAESWSKNILLRKWFPYGLMMSVDLRPIVELPNGDILFSQFNGSGIIRLNPGEKRSTEVRITEPGQPISLVSYADTYAPKFDSLSEERIGGQYMRSKKKNVCSTVLLSVLPKIVWVLLAIIIDIISLRSVLGLCVTKFVGFVFRIMQ